MGITRELADFATAPVHGIDAQAMMRLSLFDWAACGIAGQGEPVSEILRGLVLAEGGKGCSVIGGGFANARSAALANGTISHALDYDDTHFAHIGHPSVAIIPAALAVAEQVDAKGAAFLDACLIGVELSIRVGMWLGRDHYQTGFHQTATAGAFGAAAAAGRLLGLDTGQMAHTLGLLSTRASGLKSQFGTMGKPYNAGIAASNGVEVALLVAAGFVSNPKGLEVAQGFGTTHSGQTQELALGGLGTDWKFETISHKFHACCHGLHAMLEAIRSVSSQISVENIDAVDIVIHPRWLSVCNIDAPTTGLEAKFSYRLTAAMALGGSDTGAMESFSDAICQDAEIIALRDKVRVETDVTLAETAAKVTVRMGNHIVTAEHGLDAPLAIDARAQKLRSKAAALIGDAGTLMECVHGEVDVKGLAQILRGQR